MIPRHFSEDKKAITLRFQDWKPQHRDSKTRKQQHWVSVDFWPLCPLIKGGGNQAQDRNKRQIHWHIQIIFYRGINAMQNFCVCITLLLYVHVTYTVVTVYAVCEGLALLIICFHKIFKFFISSHLVIKNMDWLLKKASLAPFSQIFLYL